MPYPASRSKPFPVGGVAIRIEATVTRPANTTQYTAGDQVADSATAPNDIEFANCALENGRSGWLIDAICIDSAAQATKPNLRLYIFDSAPTPNNDNAAWAPSDADANNVIACFEFSSWEVGNSTTGAGGNCMSFAAPITGQPVPFVCGASVANLYGGLVDRGGYTPVSGEIFTISLGIVQD